MRKSARITWLAMFSILGPVSGLVGTVPTTSSPSPSAHPSIATPEYEGLIQWAIGVYADAGLDLGGVTRKKKRGSPGPVLGRRLPGLPLLPDAGRGGRDLSRLPHSLVGPTSVREVGGGGSVLPPSSSGDPLTTFHYLAPGPRCPGNSWHVRGFRTWRVGSGAVSSPVQLQ
jgi:hypothetical protein